MKITKQDIKEFVENHFSVHDISIKSQTLSLHRAYFCYLCYKYSTDIINTVQLCRFLDIKQHGTIINGLTNIENGALHDKRIKIELSYLEIEFLKHFNVDNIIIQVQSMDRITLNRKLINVTYKNKKLQQRINKLKQYEQ